MQRQADAHAITVAFGAGLGLAVGELAGPSCAPAAAVSEAIGSPGRYLYDRSAIERLFARSRLSQMLESPACFSSTERLTSVPIYTSCLAAPLEA